MKIHSCGYHCQIPACIKAQRDELVAKYVAQPLKPSKKKAKDNLVRYFSYEDYCKALKVASS